MSTLRPRMWAIGLLSAALIATAFGVALLPAEANTADSAVTNKVTSGPFSGVSVTVAKTKNLVNEVVEVTWSGATPTDEQTRRHYFQLMQCWGDDPTGPRPEQCQFGATTAVRSIGLAVNSRKVRAPKETGGLPQDPAETRPAGPNGIGYVPFEAADGRTVDGDSGTRLMFDQTTTNEIPVARTRADGRGQEFFEVQTAVEAPGLGCGQAVGTGSAKRARSCWLVIVPRNDTEVDGTVRSNDSGVHEVDQALQTSPLSKSNWDHRVVFPLTFELLGGSCRNDVAPVPVVGNEFATEAITRWQPKLCESSGSVFSFAQLPDDVVRAGLASTDPALGIIGRPPAGPPATGQPVYAPLSVSGFGFAYNLEVRTLPSDPVAVQQRAGERITDLNLTPRLVAKLLTQSYQYGTTVPTVLDPKNPLRMEDDPEFKEHNGKLLDGVNKIASNSLWTIVTPLNPADAFAQVWQWIRADAEARDFLAGKPDPHGMVINPAWKEADLNVSSFPKLDQGCRPETAASGPLCVPDAFAYANDMHEGLLAATRGDTLARNSWDRLAAPPLYKKSPPQEKGTRGIIVAADTATAARYNLPMAKLRNANGKFVAPNTANLLAAVKAFKPSSATGVLVPDPNVKVDNAYPLTVVSYAATVPAALSAKARQAYAGLLRYAYGPGQQPGVAVGSLPAGYAPMPSNLTAAAKAAANAIANYRPSAPKPGSSGGGGGVSGSGGTGSGSTGGGSTRGGGTPPLGPDGSGTPAEVPNGSPASGGEVPGITPAPGSTGFVPSATGTSTPAVEVGGSRLSLIWLLICALLAAALGRGFPRLRALGSALKAPGQPARPVPNTTGKRGGDAGA